MLYRKMGRTDWMVSILGFGCMRLPLLGSKGGADLFDPSKAIDEEQAEKMVNYAIENGVNYFDTAYPYHGGKSEVFIGRVLKPHRERILIATKMPTWLIQKTSDFERYLEEQLTRLDMDVIDVYLLHGLNASNWPKIKELGVFEFIDRLLADGRVRKIGFSYHDEAKLFKKIVDEYDWTMCQIQYNYFDEHNQAGKEGLEYAAAKGLGVVIMEPLRGGKLTDKIPAEIQQLWDSARQRRTPAEWALRWVWNHAGVTMALSGMSAWPQVLENIKIAEHGLSNSLGAEELDLIKRVSETYHRMLKVPCTGCGYCQPCPAGVAIPTNLNLYNDFFMFKDPDIALMIYNHMLAPETRASNCAECGECEEKCPQHIAIPEELKKVHAQLAR
ncbi:MAG: aldo/keto reductase [Deltaproteobacteria bacterium]|nr:aldo/keto reductase [Deltaproteobacteria bacterium]